MAAPLTNVKMSEKFSKLSHLLHTLVEVQKETNVRLDKIAGLLTSDQLLTECVGPDGEPRSAESCADIVSEAFSAGLALQSEFDQRNRDYQYAKEEFFIGDDEDDEEDDDENEERSNITKSF